AGRGLRPPGPGRVHARARHPAGTAASGGGVNARAAAQRGAGLPRDARLSRPRPPAGRPWRPSVTTARMSARGMLARLRTLEARLLPHGVVDVVRQVALFAAAYWAYRLVRGAVDGRAAAAFQHARE